MMAHALAGGTEVQGGVGLIDSWHHVSAGVNEGSIEIFTGGHDVEALILSGAW
jgi:hypothetical protein